MGNTDILHTALMHTLDQIMEILTLVQDLPETKAVAFYRGDNAGKHIRHVLDHFLALKSSEESGIVDYNLRNRESVVETDWHAAREQLLDIEKWLQTFVIEEKETRVISEIDVNDTASCEFNSNIAREILYLINHTIHHTAYIALLAKGQGIKVPSYIGIAPSTATYMREAVG